MRRIIVIIPILVLGAISCLSYNLYFLQTTSGTQTSIVTLPPPAIYTPEVNPTFEQEIPPGTDTPPLQETSDANQPENNQGKIGEPVACGNLLIVRVMQPVETTRDLFEHHANGTFLIVLLEIENISDAPIQIWDEDYYLEGQVNGVSTMVSPQKAATGYLFITRGNNLSQDEIIPGNRWKTYLAFDVSLDGSGWKLIVTPGKEGGDQVCEAVILLNP